MNKIDVAREIRFYVCLFMGFALLILGFYAEPPGHIGNSVLCAAGGLAIIGAVGVGMDIKGIIHELVKLREINVKVSNDNKQDAE